MLSVRLSKDRGVSDFGWFKSIHSFSFGNYYDPNHMGWGNLRVINDDHLAASRGGSPHPHRDMEIISYVITGSLAHEDSMGNGTRIPAGDVQYMSAGTGVKHNEFSATDSETTHFLQIWFEPDQKGLQPAYGQVSVPAEQKRGRLRLVASQAGGEGVIRFHANARMYAGLFDGAEQAELKIDPSRKAYVHVVSGELTVNGTPLKGGDAALLANEADIKLTNGKNAEVVVFDLEP